MKFLKYLLCFLLLGCICYATVHGNSIANIHVDFCSPNSGDTFTVSQDGKTLVYKIQTNIPYPLCYTVKNTSTQTQHILIKFVDGTYTNDQRRNKACSSQPDKNIFATYITGLQSIVTLPAGLQQTFTGLLLYPTGTDGIYQGCLVYSIVPLSPEVQHNTSNLSIVMRKAKFIDLLVGDYERANQSSIQFVKHDAFGPTDILKHPYLRVYLDPHDNKPVVQFTLQNTGTLAQDVQIHIMIGNIRNPQKIAFDEARVISRGETLLISKKFDALPWYMIRVNIHGTYKPYDAIPGIELSGMHGDLHMQAYTRIYNTTFLVTVVVIGFVLLLLGIRIIRSIHSRKIASA